MRVPDTTRAEREGWKELVGIADGVRVRKGAFYHSRLLAAAVQAILAQPSAHVVGMQGALSVAGQLAMQSLPEYRSRGHGKGKGRFGCRRALEVEDRNKYARPHQGPQERARRVVGGWAGGLRDDSTWPFLRVSKEVALTASDMDRKHNALKICEVYQ